MSAGKGSKPRPVNMTKYRANYDAIFRRKPVAAPSLRAVGLSEPEAPAPAVLPPVGTAGPAVRPNYIWRGDLGDDCTCRVADLVAHCECLGEIKWKPDGRGRFYMGEIWFVCVSRVDANNRTDGPDLFHSGEHGGYVIGAELARGIAEAIISAALAENCQLPTANFP